MLYILSTANTMDLTGVTTLLNIGVTGIVVVLFVQGKIRRGADYDAERSARVDQDKWIKETAIPLLTSVAETLKDAVSTTKESTALLNDLKRERDRYIRILEERK